MHIVRIVKNTKIADVLKCRTRIYFYTQYKLVVIPYNGRYAKIIFKFQR